MLMNMIMNNWLNKWESNKEDYTELMAYENELIKAINESLALEQLKAINYRIEMIRDKINDLKK